MDNIYVREVLSPTDLQKIRNNYEGLVWQSGTVTSSSNHKINLQAITNNPSYLEIDKLIVDKFFQDQELYYMTLSTEITRTIISKMDMGGKYGIHTDAPELGHYSTTTFLSDPSEYEGGELCLKVDKEVKKFKLPAGHSVTYLTGIPHCVSPVVGGTRIVAINWTTSKYPDILEREFAGDIERIYDITSEEDSYCDTFEESTNSLGYLVSELRSKYMRRHL